MPQSTMLLLLLAQSLVRFSALFAWGFAFEVYQQRDLYRRASKKAVSMLQQAIRHR